MEIELTVTESEYREIVRWIDEGGASRNVNYRVIPDINATDEEGEQDDATMLHTLETVA